MFTPHQIEQISFDTQTFGGYKISDVDEFLEPLMEDYVTLYKENALLKSKMRVLVGKLEEYRKNEAAMKDAIVNAQRTCDKMVREAESKCAQMLGEANATASRNVSNADALIAAENARVEEARRASAGKITEIQDQMRACVQALERIKTANVPVAAPAPAAAPAQAFDYDAANSTDSVAAEISQSVEALVGTTTDTQPKAEPRHPVNDTTTSKFANLQFGRNYDPTHK